MFKWTKGNLEMYKPMFFYALLALLIGCFSGCLSQPFTDMANNNFTSIQEELAPTEIQGLWTGSIAHALVTYKINADGSGIQCMSPTITSSPLAKIKYMDGKIFSQGGTKLMIKSEKNAILTLVSPYFDGSTFRFYKDDGLEKAAIECKKALSELNTAIQ
ncbi:MAG: hypothetical protein KDI39_13015 [Pseudomonadales bacterium]|nr:hypothetical protein [Pseudomonadales bacterium]